VKKEKKQKKKDPRMGRFPTPVFGVLLALLENVRGALVDILDGKVHRKEL
jgi:hypothetical protein